MKNIFKKLLLSTLVFIMIFSNNYLYANNTNNKIYKYTINSNRNFFFQSALDLERFKNLQINGLKTKRIDKFNLKSACFPGDPGYPYCDSYKPIKTRTTFVSKKLFSKKFMGYNRYTPNWSKAKNYKIIMEIQQSFSINLSYESILFTANASLTEGVHIDIPANPKKYSRLGFKADILAKKYKVETLDANTNRVISTGYYVEPKVLNTYNTVIYK